MEADSSQWKQPDETVPELPQLRAPELPVPILLLQLLPFPSKKLYPPFLLLSSLSCLYLNDTSNQSFLQARRYTEPQYKMDKSWAALVAPGWEPNYLPAMPLPL